MKPLAQPLLDLLAECIRKGHWKVAIRRYLMLLALSHELPEDLKARCDSLIAKYARKDLEVIAADVLAWTDMVSRDRAPRPLLLHQPVGPVALGLPVATKAPLAQPPSLRPLPTAGLSAPRRKSSRSGSSATLISPVSPQLAPTTDRPASLSRQRLMPPLRSDPRRQRVHRFIAVHAAFHGIRALSSMEVALLLRAKEENAVRVLKLNLQELRKRNARARQGDALGL